MNEAPCSWRVSTYSIDDLDSASTNRMFSSPGMPKTCVTPSFSRHSTMSSAVVRLGSLTQASLVSAVGGVDPYDGTVCADRDVAAPLSPLTDMHSEGHAAVLGGLDVEPLVGDVDDAEGLWGVADCAEHGLDIELAQI